MTDTDLSSMKSRLERALLESRTFPTWHLFTPRNKFVTGIVADITGETYFLKVAAKTPPNYEGSDLANESYWNTHAYSHMVANGFRIPSTIKIANDGSWALFEFLEGGQLTEDDLEENLHDIARLCACIVEIPLQDDDIYQKPNGLGAWCENRIDRALGKSDNHPFSKNQTYMMRRVLKNADQLVRASVHGDVNLKNLIGGRELGLVDAEFGVTPQRSGWGNLRYHDAAYFYHLLHCQYHRPDLAEKFLEHFLQEVTFDLIDDVENFEYEFYTSLLERTLSMGNHFVWNRDPSKEVDDPRRTEVGPYLEIVERSLDVLVPVK